MLVGLAPLGRIELRAQRGRRLDEPGQRHHPEAVVCHIHHVLKTRVHTALDELTCGRPLVAADRPKSANSTARSFTGPAQLERRAEHHASRVEMRSFAIS